MKKINTKEQILEVALDLFSKKGFEATSMNDIADAVGIRKASLYAHYDSKEEILKTITKIASENYDKKTILNKYQFDNYDLSSPKGLIKEVKKQVKFIIHDKHISKIRKLYTIEQFVNKKMSKAQQNYSYDYVMNYGNKLIKYLIKNGILINMNTEIMTAQLFFPISIWIYECDRDLSKEKEVMKLIEKHICQFYEVYKK